MAADPSAYTLFSVLYPDALSDKRRFFIGTHVFPTPAKGREREEGKN
jgi:hypothetical protein